MLRKYKPGPLEIYIERKYKEKGIILPSDLTVDNIVEKFDIVIVSGTHKSASIWNGRTRVVFLKRGLSEMEVKRRIMHELAHVLRHNFNELEMTGQWNEYYEVEAERFALAGSIPYFMLLSLDPDELMYTQRLAEIFHVPLAIVRKRIELILCSIDFNRYNMHRDIIRN